MRVRTGNSPKVLWNHRYTGRLAETGEEVGYRAPVWAQAQLFRVTDASGAPLYLSFGGDMQTGRIRSISCYRRAPGMKRLKGGGATPEASYQWSRMEPTTESWAPPQGVELCIVRSGPDTPDQIARLVEWLRQCYAHYGTWTSKPAPLYFEQVLKEYKEYLADYSYDLDEADDGTQEKGEKGLDGADDE